MIRPLFQALRFGVVAGSWKLDSWHDMPNPPSAPNHQHRAD